MRPGFAVTQVKSRPGFQNGENFVGQAVAAATFPTLFESILVRFGLDRATDTKPDFDTTI